jgi:hypothetical protein
MMRKNFVAIVRTAKEVHWTLFKNVPPTGWLGESVVNGIAKFIVSSLGE